MSTKFTNQLLSVPNGLFVSQFVWVDVVAYDVSCTSALVVHVWVVVSRKL